MQGVSQQVGSLQYWAFIATYAIRVGFSGACSTVSTFVAEVFESRAPVTLQHASTCAAAPTSSMRFVTSKSFCSADQGAAAAAPRGAAWLRLCFRVASWWGASGSCGLWPYGVDCLAAVLLHVSVS